MENKDIFGEASVLHHSSDIDDLLKSVEDLDYVKQLVKNIINMCKSGCFYLTKFISNNKELLLSLPKHQKKTGVNDQDLSGDLPNEKALGICWNSREDIFSFKLKLEAAILSKAVMLLIISSEYDPLRFTAPFILEGRRILQGLRNQDINWDSEVNGVPKKYWKNWVSKF